MRIEFDEYRLKLEAMKSDLDDLASAIGLSALKEEVEALEAEAAKDGFWDDRDNSQKVLQRTKQVRAKIDRYQALVSRWDDAVTLVQLAIEAEDDEMLEEIISEHDGVAAALEEMRLSTLLSGEYDGLNAILAFHPGAGGTEAQDWAQMLYRMYTRWAERHDFTYQILDFLDGEEAGIKSATILIKGENA
ncbi:MAG: PCRF domain-containing protein, partial [Clostridia bacterium]|nr:PCRF domain-containing protein [Clostridia bacterium]